MTGISRRKALLTLGAAGVAATALPGLVRAQKNDVIRFGGSLGMSGRYGETGLNVRHGYETAVKFLNEELKGVDIGGRRYRFALEVVDDASDPARATALVQRSLDDGVDFFLGSYGSNVVLPCAGITEAQGKVTVQIGGSADTIFTQGYRNIFGFFPRASRSWESTVAFFQTVEPKLKTISVISTNDAFSKFNAEAVIKGTKGAGIELLDHLQLPEQISDASSALATLRARRPDLLVCTTVDQNSLAVVRQMVATGTTVPMLFQFLGPQLPLYRQSLGANATGILYYVPWDDLLNFPDPFFGDTKAYLAYYSKHNKRAYSYHTVGASACIATYVKAMQQAGSLDPKKVRDAIAAIDFSTAFGRVKFAEGGDADPIAMGASAGQIVDGKTQIVYPAQVATAKLIHPMPAWSRT